MSLTDKNRTAANSKDCLHWESIVMVKTTDMDDKLGAKRVSTELEDDEGSPRDVISLLQQLNSKMDVLTVTVSGNSVAIKEIDVRLTTKIDNLESSVVDRINKVKSEVESQILDLTTDINQRVNNIVADTQSSCQGNAIAIQNTSSKMDNMLVANEYRFNKLERNLLRNELIVTGVPAAHGEVIMDIVGDICNALQCNLNGGDVIAAYRLPSSKAKSGKLHNERLPSPIVLKLGSDWAKQQLLSAYFTMKNLNIGDIGYQMKSRIYINESLTIQNRAIFKAASDAKKSKLITKCYTRNGIVHIQINDEGRIFRINDIDPLNAIISQPPITQTNGSSSDSSKRIATQTTTDPKSAIQAQPTTKPDDRIAMHDGEPME